MTVWPDYPEGPNDPRPTAIHEAGHAVMACRLKIAFRCVTIDPNLAEGQKGRVVAAVRAVASREHAHDWMLFCLAGHAACDVAGVLNHGWYDDSDEALNRTAAIWWKGEDPQGAYDNAKSHALEMMRTPENAAAVERVAEMLIEREIVGRDAVMACISRSDRDLTR